ncbi:DUF4418 family protein [bacterium 210820-DFI.6.37]|nr:DUF4418 family protein [bacterium 210820-DFI.6.37]
MENRRVWCLLGALAFVVSIASIMSAVFIGACSCGIETAAGSQVPMKCFWTERTVLFVSIIPAAIAACQIFIKEKTAGYISAISLLICSVVIILITCDKGIGVCDGEGMNCKIMAICVRLNMVFLAVISIIQLFYAGKRRNIPKRGF